MGLWIHERGAWLYNAFRKFDSSLTKLNCPTDSVFDSFISATSVIPACCTEMSLPVQNDRDRVPPVHRRANGSPNGDRMTPLRGIRYPQIPI